MTLQLIRYTVLRSHQLGLPQAFRALTLISIWVCVAGLPLHLQADVVPTEFFVVSEVTSDAAPFWYHYVLHVTALGRDTLVRYIRIAPMDSICADSIVVKAATVKLPDVQPAGLVSAYHICAADPATLSRKLKRRTHPAAIDDSVRFGIVASCGSKEVVIHLPYPEQAKLEDLRKKSPQLARWWDLQESVKQRAFGSGEVFYHVSAEQEDRLLHDGESAIAALRSGRFDKGLLNNCKSGSGCCKPPSFAYELAGYVGPVGSQGQVPKLSQAARYRFKHYVDPKYPPLARQARVQGIVKLDLSIDPSTGRVLDVNIVLGHPLFRESVMSAARQWQFEPDDFGNSQSVPAELVFQFRCPAPTNQ